MKETLERSRTGCLRVPSSESSIILKCANNHVVWLPLRAVLAAPVPAARLAQRGT